MQRTGQTLPCQAPRHSSRIPKHPSLNRRCNTRACRQNSLLQIITARSWQMARNEAALLAYRVATPRHCLKSRKPFSTRCRNPLNQRQCLRAAGNGASGHYQLYRHTVGVHRQMQLAVQPPLVRAMAWFPPRVPAAWGWALM